MQGSDERWIQWWCAPWHWAHPDWKIRFVERCGFSAGDCDAVLSSYHSVFLQYAGIAPSQPPAPVAPLLQWLELDAGRQRQALSLVGRLCLPPHREVVVEDVEAAHEAWCRAVTKALRPGLWLDPDIYDPRLLLAAWVGEVCWSRLRLQWSPDESTLTFIDMPANKLQTIWQSVLWRIATP
ncbi:type III secretion protein [Pseudomonas sp. FP1740]|jgi:hypothetical protein|uniref:type III secretion protein n=1 Tax=Pseudomonas sp. FP1740 TaxID=2954078 RepID=UPI0027329FC2|nr:type III secretion protein [Pseudomonas sp. FP1740]WLG46818.1 type III secretion protein [Pseudomonas sp. FP1740]